MHRATDDRFLLDRKRDYAPASVTQGSRMRVLALLDTRVPFRRKWTPSKPSNFSRELVPMHQIRSAVAVVAILVIAAAAGAALAQAPTPSTPPPASPPAASTPSSVSSAAVDVSKWSRKQ